MDSHTRRPGGCNNERGMVLPLALMALVLLLTMSLALLGIGSNEVQTAANQYRGAQAVYMADAGLEDALHALIATPSTVSSATGTLAIVPGLAGPGASLSPVGSYSVRYKAAGTNTVLFVSIGTTTIGGSSRTLRALVTTNFVANFALLTGGDLSVAGDATIGGACGSVHTNGSLTINGNPTVSKDATSSQTYTAHGHPNIGGQSGGGTPAVSIPTIDPAAFLTAAKSSLAANKIFQMNANGQVLDGNNSLITTLANGQTYNAWTYSAGTPAQWRLNGNTGTDGVYYFQGNVNIAGNPGSQSQPWNTTILATGTLQVTGNPDIQALLTDTLFVAGSDISIAGNPDLGFRGFIGSNEQVSINGNPSFNGFIIAKATTSANGLVVQDSVNGSPTITFDCGLHPPLTASPRMLTWGQ